MRWLLLPFSAVAAKPGGSVHRDDLKLAATQADALDGIAPRRLQCLPVPIRLASENVPALVHSQRGFFEDLAVRAWFAAWERLFTGVGNSSGQRRRLQCRG